VRRPHQESRQEDQNINESIVLKLVLIMQTGLNWLGICLIMNSGRSQSPCQSYCAIDGRSVSQYVFASSLFWDSWHVNVLSDHYGFSRHGASSL